MTFRVLPIQSAQNVRFKQALRLRQSRQRRRSERILIDGQREILCAIDAGVQVHELFVPATAVEAVDSGQAPHDFVALLARLASGGAELLSLPDGLLERISYGGRTDQWLATATPPDRTLADLRLSDQPLVAILEGVEKPGNLGAVVRSADGAGVEAVIVVDGGTDLYNPNAIRASRGTIFTLPVVSASTNQVQAWLRQQGVTTLVARPNAALPYDQVDFRQPVALVLGSEALGVSSAWLGDDYSGICLPMRGRADSLNVSITAAILFYEAQRQRHRE
ncbi:MAG: RNA methyltransferase [Planctomycetales bacterium]|nr:RNA methyltransferase [Planctomycetales bacterium]